MRSLMVVIPDEFLDGSAARRKGDQRSNVKAFVIDRAKEPLDFAVGLRRIRPKQMMRNTEMLASLLKPCQPIGMPRSVKLQDLFTNLKVPRERRHRLVVATTAQDEIFWVEGLRIGEQFKIESPTKRHLKWSWRRHESD